MRAMIAALCSAMLMAGGGAQAQQSPVRSYSQKTLLKNWALSRCLALSAADAADREDASAAAGAYLEFGRQPGQAYEALERLAAAYAARDYRGRSNSRLNTMKCIDLFHSKELDRMAARYARLK